jgi:hypothetical protein
MQEEFSHPEKETLKGLVAPLYLPFCFFSQTEPVQPVFSLFRQRVLRERRHGKGQGGDTFTRCHVKEREARFRSGKMKSLFAPQL